jgi:hypothetical protein
MERGRIELRANGRSSRNIFYNRRMRLRLMILAILVALPISAATIAPPTIPHPMAMFLGELSKEGKVQVTFRASAFGTHFFLAEPSGVTVYVYDEKSVGYRKETFLKGYTLARAMKKYK